MQLELFPDEDRLLLKEKLVTLKTDFDIFLNSHYQSKKKFRQVCLEDRIKIHLLKEDIIKRLQSLQT